MKILFVDTSIGGHHLSYINLLANCKEYSSIFLLPEEPVNFMYKTYVDDFDPTKRWNVKGYIKWINKVNFIAEKEKVDIVHFLYADAIYRFCGLAFSNIKKSLKL